MKVHLGAVICIVASCLFWPQATQAQKVTGYEWFVISDHAHGVSSIAFSSNAKYMASGSLDKTVKIWQMPKAN